MVELFTRYMYYARAKLGVKDTTTPALRLFFEGGNNYKSLNDESVFNELESLANFWKRLYRPDEFSDKTKKQLFILQYAPNGMWTYLTSVYFLARKVKEYNLDEEAFNQFLDKITAFIIKRIFKYNFTSNVACHNYNSVFEIDFSSFRISNVTIIKYLK